MAEAAAPAGGDALERASASGEAPQPAGDAEGDTDVSGEEKERAASGEKASTSGRAAVPGGLPPSPLCRATSEGYCDCQKGL